MRVDVYEQSEKYKLNKNDGLKILKGAGIALGGTLGAYLLQVIPMVDFGEFTPMIAAILMIIINTGLKWINPYLNQCDVSISVTFFSQIMLLSPGTMAVSPVMVIITLRRCSKSRISLRFLFKI